MKPPSRTPADPGKSPHVIGRAGDGKVQCVWFAMVTYLCGAPPRTTSRHR
jgi:hypothetical protein